MVEEKTERTWICIRDDVLPVEPVSDFLRVPEAGGVDLFLGTTRRWTGERETVLLRYDCYEAMAAAEMKRLIDEAGGRWPLLRACLHHRTGEVPLREISVIVGVSTPHRDAAFRACRFLIDELKKRVPIWKNEEFADGTTEWIEGERPPLSSE